MQCIITIAVVLVELFTFVVVFVLVWGEPLCFYRFSFQTKVAERQPYAGYKQCQISPYLADTLSAEHRDNNAPLPIITETFLSGLRS